MYEWERWRCNGGGQVFTAEAPAEVGPDKYDGNTAGMIAQIKYGGGVSFHQLEKWQAGFGIPLPAATEWVTAEGVAERIKAAWDELIR